MADQRFQRERLEGTENTIYRGGARSDGEAGRDPPLQEHRPPSRAGPPPHAGAINVQIVRIDLRTVRRR
jgi:hypothetical protein